jgi:hypothetical protein
MVVSTHPYTYNSGRVTDSNIHYAGRDAHSYAH